MKRGKEINCELCGEFTDRYKYCDQCAVLKMYVPQYESPVMITVKAQKEAARTNHLDCGWTFDQPSEAVRRSLAVLRKSGSS